MHAEWRDLRDGDSSCRADPSACGRLLRASWRRARLAEVRPDDASDFVHSQTGLRVCRRASPFSTTAGRRCGCCFGWLVDSSSPRVIRRSISAFHRSHRLRLVRWMTKRSNCAETSLSGPRAGWRSPGHWLRRQHGALRSQRSPSMTSTSTRALSRSRAASGRSARIGALSEWGIADAASACVHERDRSARVCRGGARDRRAGLDVSSDQLGVASGRPGWRARCSSDVGRGVGWSASPGRDGQHRGGCARHGSPQSRSGGASRRP